MIQRLDIWLLFETLPSHAWRFYVSMKSFFLVGACVVWHLSRGFFFFRSGEIAISTAFADTSTFDVCFFASSFRGDG